MILIYKISLIVHIIAGITALATGCAAALLKKKRGTHSRVGFIYFIAMTGVCISGLTLSFVRDLPFFVAISVFSYYMCWTGYSAAHWKNNQPKWLLWIIPFAGLGAAGYLFTIQNIVPWVFGGIQVMLSLADLGIASGLVKDKRGKAAWMFNHGARMGGSYIATTTAFLVVNVQLEALPWLPWLLPTVVGTIIMTRWSMKLKKSLMKTSEAATQN